MGSVVANIIIILILLAVIGLLFFKMISVAEHLTMPWTDREVPAEEK